MIVILLVLTVQAGFVQGANPNSPFLKDYESIDFQIESLNAHRLSTGVLQKVSKVDHQLSNDATVRVRFTAYNRVFDLELSQNKLDLFAPDASLTVQGVGQVPLKTQHLYSGHVVGDPASEVFGWILDGVFQGSVKLSTGDLYHIESSMRYTSTNSSRAIVYRDVDLHPRSRLRGKLDSPFHSSRCGTKTKFFPQNGSGTRSRWKRDSTAARKTCLIYFKVDIFYWNLIFNAEGQQDNDVTTSQITANVAQLVYAVNSIFTPTEMGSSGSGYSMKISKIEIDTSQSCLNSQNPLCIEPNVTSAFSLHFHSCVNYNAYCVAFLLTDHIYEEGTIGLAYTPDDTDRTVGICSRYTADGVLQFKNYINDPNNDDLAEYGTTWINYVGFNCTQQSRNTGLVTTRSEDGLLARREHELTITHEIGHTFGAQHDPDSCTPTDANGGKYVMAPYVSSGSLPNNAHFSPCSIKDIDSNLVSLRQDENDYRYDCLAHDNETSIPPKTLSLSTTTTPMSADVILGLEIGIPVSVIVVGAIVGVAVACYIKKKTRRIEPV